MAKLFVHFNAKADFTAATLGTEYDNNSIVFIKDTQEIWTHGTFYAIPDTYKEKITNLETAVSALQAAQAAMFAVKKVSDGTNTFAAASGKETLTLKGGANTNVTVNAVSGEVTIASTLTPTSYYPNASGTALETRVTNLEDNTIAGEDAIVATTADNGNTTVKLKLDNTGTVTLSQSAAGLKAEVNDIEALAAVQGVADNDKVLTLANKKISSTINLAYDSDAKKINLTGVGGVSLGSVDCTNFLVDGMLNSASFDEATHKLTLTFNSDGGKQPIEVDLSKLVDVYDGSNLKLKAVAIPTEAAEEPTANDSVDSAVANLIKRDRELKAEIDKINSDISDVQLGGLIAIEKGTDGKFVTTTVTDKSSNKQSVSVAVKTDVAITDATNTNDGLATAYAVQQYVTDMLAWGEY